ncbi:MAG: hypothetical protein C4320_04180 [Armatimonadota bacterium]
MNRRARLRRALAPVRSLRRELFAAFFGILLAIYGFLVAFNAPLQALIRNAVRLGRKLARHVAPPGTFPSAEVDLAVHWIGAGLLIIGLYLLFQAGRRIASHVIETFDPSSADNGAHGKVDTYVRRQRLAAGPRVVAIGGGTGLSTLLRGLKGHTSNITAIVAVTDDGGSSGRIRSEKGMIPPGDIRNCLVALADSETRMASLFQHRFRANSGALSGHSIGNLLIAALVDQAHGDFEAAIASASDVLAIRGEVMPATLAHLDLIAEFDDGQVVQGESAITKAEGRIRRIRLSDEHAAVYAPVLQAIAQAELICLGPGSVFTSVIPPLLVPGISEAIANSSARKVYICNVMTQPGESQAMSASDHAAAILANVAARPFDEVLVNRGVPAEEAVRRYEQSGQTLVDADTDRIRALGLRPIVGDFVSGSDVVRHDPTRVAARLMALLGV